MAIQMKQEPLMMCCFCTNDNPKLMKLLGYLINEKGKMMLCDVCGKAFKVLD